MSYYHREFINKTILTETTLSLINLHLNTYTQESTTKVRLNFITVTLQNQTHLQEILKLNNI